VPQATPLPQAAPTTPPPETFLNKELPRVGVILSGGGLKTFAHLGVLREFQRARIPIHSVAGLEWGAVIGGLYSMLGQVNDAEWKAFKLKETDLPSGGGFLSTKIKPQPISSLNGFLDTAFANSTIERGKIEFGCPSYSIKSDKVTWQSRGSLKDAMARCLPYPPFFTDNGGVFASPFSIDEAAAWLRSRGANVIVLVNVLAGGEIFPPKLYSEEYAESLLWYEARREGLRAKEPIVNWVVNVDTTGHPITDFAGRRALMDSGAKAATSVVNKMASHYGF
jgi:NTE family protein